MVLVFLKGAHLSHENIGVIKPVGGIAVFLSLSILSCGRFSGVTVRDIIRYPVCLRLEWERLTAGPGVRKVDNSHCTVQNVRKPGSQFGH